MSEVEAEKAKEILKQARDDMFDFREILGFPVLRRPLIMLREQMKLMSQTPQTRSLSPEEAQALRQQLESRQPQPPVEEERIQRPAVFRETLPQLPRLPLPLGLRQRVEKIKLMPIRRGIGEVLRSYSQYISSPKQRKREEEENAYQEQEKDLEASEMAQARLRRHGVYKRHSIEM